MGAPPGLIKKGQVMSLPSLKSNLGVLGFCRVLTSVLVGTASGILGITGWKGFIVYISAHIMLAFPLLMKAGFNAPKYFSSWSTLLLSMVFSTQSLLSFVLFWIIFYNVAHVF